MLKWFRSRSLEDEIEKRKKVKLRGVRFILKKIDPINYVDGSKVLLDSYQVYEVGGKKERVLTEGDKARMRKHYIDCFMASVVHPRLSRMDGEEGSFFVDKFFDDWEFATELYQEILLVSYGKKKLKSLELQGKNLLK